MEWDRVSKNRYRNTWYSFTAMLNVRYRTIFKRKGSGLTEWQQFSFALKIKINYSWQYSVSFYCLLYGITVEERIYKSHAYPYYHISFAEKKSVFKNNSKYFFASHLNCFSRPIGAFILSRDNCISSQMG